MTTRTALVAAVFGVAVTATLTGTLALIDFDTAPGISLKPPALWPKISTLPRALGHKQIVVIAHPQCGCTRATIEELAAISGASLSVLFFRPGPDAGWPKGPAWEEVEKAPGAAALWDDGGREAKIFGGSTSGSVLLYGERGDLLYSGGITASRGHAGPNRGLTELELAIRTGLPRARSIPVFGCSLFSSGNRS